MNQQYQNRIANIFLTLFAHKARIRSNGALAAILFSCGQLVSAAVLAPDVSNTPADQPNDLATHKEVAQLYGKLPMRFEENRGQSAKEVKYLSQGHGYSLFLTPTEAVLSLRQHSVAGADAKLLRETSNEQLTNIVRLEFAGTHGASKIYGEQPLESKSNYFIGNDPTQWLTGVANFAKVRYSDIYPGIDAVYYGNEQQLEYDFVVAPEGDPNDIRLAFEGIKKLEVDHEGDLLLHTQIGILRQKKPIAYQVIDGQRRYVDSHYVRRGAHEMGIAIARYDRSAPLVVDPTVLYSTYLGGSDTEEGLGIAVDKAGNAYVSGWTQSSDFPNTAGLQSSIRGPADIFVTKLNASGTSLIFSTYLGGKDGDYAQGLTLDDKGNVYIAGQTKSIDFPTTPGVLQSGFSGAQNSLDDAFVAKLSADGAKLLYATYLGGTNTDVAKAIAVDASENAYVTGFTCSNDFPLANPYQPFFNGNANCIEGIESSVFLSKLNSSGSKLIYSTYFSGGSDVGSAVAVNENNEAFITGLTWSKTFPAIGNPLFPYRGSADPFVSKFDAAGWPVYSTFLGGTAYDAGTGIAVDGKGEIYVTGFSQSFDFPTKNAFQPSYHGNEDAFVTKLDIVGTKAWLVYSTYLGGTGDERSFAIAVDENGSAYVTGYTQSVDFPVVLPIQPALHIFSDAFVTVLTASGSPTFSTFFGGNSVDSGNGIAVDGADGAIYITGITGSTDLSMPGAFQTAQQGSLDAFVAKIGMK